MTMTRLLLSLLLLALIAGRTGAEEEYASEAQNIPPASGAISALATQLPYAYYPSRNQMEVALDISGDRLARVQSANGSMATPRRVTVRIIDVSSGKTLANAPVVLDAQQRRQTTFSVPDLPDGEYAVEYVIGKYVERSPRTFKRIHFPFEKTNYGQAHEVYPPFEAVKVDGASVTVVGRRYTVSGLGLLDSVVSLGRELLAAPMTLSATMGDGSAATWNPGTVQGSAVHADEAVFQCTASGDRVEVRSVVTVQEDGCAKVELTVAPRGSDAVILKSLAIRIPLKDAETPLFHFVADNGMRFNYGGFTPRGGRIQWYREPWDGWVPLRWRVTEPGSDDGVIWTGTDTHQHGNQHRPDHRPFVPYIWLGAEERGLAFFLESERNFATDYQTALQRIVRQGDRITLEVDVFQQPVTLSGPRTIVFGLMASPGKPMATDFRTRNFASGVGPVSCWGGWQCASKYPDNEDWSIVDRIQEIRQRGKFTPEDEAWFKAKEGEVKQRWPERKINNSTDWLWLTLHFAKRAAEQGASHSGIYFEEHATDPRLPEWEVFQDEWASAEFNRFQARTANWGVFAPSYHNFTLYMAGQWMRRGVSLYFDNTNPKRSYNAAFGPAYRDDEGKLRYGIAIFGQRAYYRRIYKLLSQWNRKGATYPIDFTVHMTNTQTLPFNTWATATLDLEQRAHQLDPQQFPPEVDVEVPQAKGDANEQEKKRQETRKKQAATAGFQMPWAPDYTRTVTFGRQVGCIPMALDCVAGFGRHYANQYTPEMLLRDWAMRRIHDIRPGGLYPKPAVLAARCEKALLDFGYGQPDRVDHHNYWAPSPRITVSDERVKWLALVQRDAAAAPMGLLLLQSYSRTDAITVQVTFPGAGELRDVLSDEMIKAANQRATIAMPALFGTRMFLVSR